MSENASSIHIHNKQQHTTEKQQPCKKNAKWRTNVRAVNTPQQTKQHPHGKQSAHKQEQKGAPGEPKYEQARTQQTKPQQQQLTN
jgi:hypothetical protein